MAHISKKSKIMFFISGEKRTHYLASLPSLQNASTFHTRHPPLVHKPSSFVAQKSLRRSGTNIIKHKLFALSRPINKLRPKFKTHFSISAKPSRFFHNPMQKNTILTFLPLADESTNYGLNLKRIFQYGQQAASFCLFSFFTNYKTSFGPYQTDQQITAQI